MRLRLIAITVLIVVSGCPCRPDSTTIEIEVTREQMRRMNSGEVVTIYCIACTDKEPWTHRVYREDCVGEGCAICNTPNICRVRHEAAEAAGGNHDD